MKPEDSAPNETNEAVLRKCDFVMARDEIAEMHRRLNEQGQREGGTYCFKNDYVAAWYAFRDNPNIQTARAFLEVAPPILVYFQQCSPGGMLCEPNSFLARTREPK